MHFRKRFLLGSSATLAFSLLSLVETSAWADPAATVDIQSPAPGTIDGGAAVKLKVKVTSIYAIKSVKAQTAFGTADLSLSGGLWSGGVSLAGAPWGNHTITIVATDAQNKQLTAQVTVAHDLFPVLTVGTLLEGTVTPDTIHVTATCVDDGPQGCGPIEVVYRNQIVASGPSPFDQMVSLAGFTPSPYGENKIIKEFGVWAKDSAGQWDGHMASVYVLPLTPARTEIEQVPEGEIREFDDARILYGSASGLRLYDRATKQDIVLSTNARSEAHLTPNGMIFVAPSGSDDHSIYEWKNGAITNLDTQKSYYDFSLLVRGNYAAFHHTTPGFPSPSNPHQVVTRRDLLAGTNAVVYDSENSLIGSPLPSDPAPIDIAPNADVFLKFEDVALYRYVAATGKTVPLAGKGKCHDAKTDGLRVVFDCFSFGGRLPGPSGQYLALEDPSIPPGLLQHLTMGIPVNSNSPLQFALENGWVVFERPNFIDETNYVTQVWRRAPDGQEEQISAFSDSSYLLPNPSGSLSPDGEVTFVHQGSLWFSKPGAAPVQGGHNAYFNGKWYFVLGRSLFLENDGTSSSSASSSSAGTTGAGTTGGSGGADGTTGGSGGADGAGGSGGNGQGGAGMVTSASTGSAGNSGGPGGKGNLGCSFSGGSEGATGLFGMGLLALAALGTRRSRAGETRRLRGAGQDR